ncbi:MAG: TerD family protein [Synergistaceae bacterium]|jgi:tellurium resistance protein TerD|nr:TerD family protein [Synergistaceae bacterium]
MPYIQRGFRCKVDEHFVSRNDITVAISVVGKGEYDSCCFGVDSSDKLSDEKYMVFFNQTASPKNEIALSGSGSNTSYKVNLAKLPAHICKLVFAVCIDGDSVMSNIQKLCVKLSQGGKDLTLNLTGADFKSEKAVIAIELYKKDVWRLNTVASGFNGGLSALLKHYGGEEALPSSVPVPQSAPFEIPQKAEKISLVKGERVCLSKNQGSDIIIENGWTAKGKDYDLKALVRYRNGKLLYVGAANDDEVLQTPDGAIKHCGDVKVPGSLENIIIKWNPDIASVAVSSYSALENGTGSFRRYGVFVRIRNGKQEIEIKASDTNANDASYTLCFGEIIYGNTPGTLEVVSLEMYSKPGSENRIGYKGDKVVMDIGPAGQEKR